MIGKTIGHFRITAKLGEGGMGAVYRAEDGKLGREVAIKVLPEGLASDPDRLARFEREAKVLASLNHPHIASIYQVEESEGVRVLVMELVEGENLAQRISRGPIPLDEALSLAAQIALALEAAHEQGVVHRDLKPANIQVTSSGRIKVLDFGLAKALQPAATSGDAMDLSQSPTLAHHMTGSTLLLGTAPYMSPEQARGHEVDRRADVWAFGCVLFEMLTGRTAFAGPTVSDTIAAILEREPRLAELPAGTPPAVRRLLERCLRKESDRRLRDMGDARIEIEEGEREPEGLQEEAAAARPRQRRAVEMGLALVAAVGLAAAAWAWLARPAASPGEASRWTLHLGPELLLATGGRSNPIAVSPDGRRIVYAAETRGNPRLYRRDVDTLETTAIPGTEGARNPFFSPDGEWVGFFSGNRLHKVSLEGGAPQSICEIPLDDLGASWGADGFIVFAAYGSGLFRVSAAGGVPEAVTTLDYAGGEVQHRWPQVLPDGEHVLFTVATGGSSRVDVVSLAGGERGYVRDIAGVSRAWLTPGDRLVYAQAGGLMAVPLDIARLEPVGNPISVLEGVASVPDLGNAYFAIADSGTIVYVPGGASGETELVWVDREGTETLAVPDRGSYMHVRLSPDGGRATVTAGSEVGTRQILLFDLDRGTRTVLASNGSTLIWNPDGSEVIYASNRSGSWNLYRAAVDGSDPGQPLLDREREQWPQSFAPDGTALAYYEVNPQAGRDIWILPMDGGDPEPFVATPFNERAPQFSPDGDWLAYVSNESGRDEVYVVPYPDRERKWTISTEGGREPLWSRDGKELFYRQGDRMMVVDVDAGPPFSAGRPRLVFEGRYETGVAGNPDWVLSADGRRFLMIKRREAAAPTRMHVVLDWFTEMDRLIAARG